MSKLTLLLGGARSGKSSYALQLAEQSGKSVTFLATAQAFDEEMSTRIAKHKSERPAHWRTIEVPFEVAAHMQELNSEIVILDCLTLLVSNLMMQFVKDDWVEELAFVESLHQEIDGLLAAIHASAGQWIVVSNEVGLGLVPPYQMGRIYRDGLGWANQRLARAAEQVILMVAGIPMVVKGER